MATTAKIPVLISLVYSKSFYFSAVTNLEINIGM